MFDGTRPLAILLTHAHLDHVNAVKALHQKYQLPIYMSKKDDAILKLTTSAPEGYHRDFEAEYFDLQEGRLQIGNFCFEIIATPGHTEEASAFDVKIISSQEILYFEVPSEELIFFFQS